MSCRKYFKDAREGGIRNQPSGKGKFSAKSQLKKSLSRKVIQGERPPEGEKAERSEEKGPNGQGHNPGKREAVNCR